jgi:hypothetical protein
MLLSELSTTFTVLRGNAPTLTLRPEKLKLITKASQSVDPPKNARLSSPIRTSPVRRSGLNLSLPDQRHLHPPVASRIFVARLRRSAAPSYLSDLPCSGSASFRSPQKRRTMESPLVPPRLFPSTLDRLKRNAAPIFRERLQKETQISSPWLPADRCPELIIYYTATLIHYILSCCARGT